MSHTESDLLAHFEGVRRIRDDEWMVRCPAHADRTPSLHITRKDTKWLFACQAGCATQDILDAIGIEFGELFTENTKHTIATYDYVDESGALLFQVVRFAPKDFRQRRPDASGGWVWNVKGIRKVPYRLPNVIAAITGGATIYVVEGENDVHAIEKAGGVATCNPGGAGKWRPEYNQHLAGAHVVVVADKDAPGYSHTDDVQRGLAGIAKTLSVVEARTGKDAADHLAAGHTLEDFVPVGAGPQSSNGKRANARYVGRYYDLNALNVLLAQPPTPTPWRVRNLVADATLTVLTGTSGDGKSWFALACCHGVATGIPVAGLVCARGGALYVDAEMGEAMYIDRLRAAGINPAEFAYVDALGLDLTSDSDLAWVQGRVDEARADLVVVDSLRRLTPFARENQSDDMAPAVANLTKMARDTGAGFLLVHHKGDSEKLWRGSTAIRDQCDALFGLLRVEGDEDSAVRRLTCGAGRGKMRYSPEPDDVWLEIEPFSGGVNSSSAPKPDPTPQKVPVWVQLQDEILAHMPAATKTEVAKAMKRDLDDKTFKRAWAALEERGRIAPRRDGEKGWVGSPPLKQKRTTTTPLRLLEDEPRNAIFDDDAEDR